MLFCLTACGDKKYDNNGNNTPTESSFSLSGDGVEQIEEGSD